MSTFTITWCERNKGCQCKKLYVQNKIWQKGDDQLWNNINIYMDDRAKLV